MGSRDRWAEPSEGGRHGRPEPRPGPDQRAGSRARHLAAARGRRGRGRHRELIGTAVTAGIRLFDTSPMYGDAERLLAGALDGRRDEVFIADKIWTRPRRKARRNWPARWTGTAAGSTSCRSTTSCPGPRT